MALEAGEAIGAVLGWGRSAGGDPKGHEEGQVLPRTTAGQSQPHTIKSNISMFAQLTSIPLDKYTQRRTQNLILLCYSTQKSQPRALSSAEVVRATWYQHIRMRA